MSVHNQRLCADRDFVSGSKLVEFCGIYFLSVKKSSVRASLVFEEVSILDFLYAGMKAADQLVVNDKLAVRASSDCKFLNKVHFFLVEHKVRNWRTLSHALKSLSYRTVCYDSCLLHNLPPNKL